MKITCKWMEKNRILVNPDGQVLPCCYLANVYYSDTQKMIERESIMKEYDNNKERYNIHNNTMEDIINSTWFTHTLPESWEDSSITIRQCKDWCGKEE